MKVQGTWGERATFVMFVFPSVVLFALFSYWPIFYSGYLSLLDYNLPRGDAAFVGAANYAELFQDEAFSRVLLNTLVYAAAVVFIAQPLAFALALLLNRPMPGRVFLRTACFTPLVAVPAAAAVVWIVLLDPQHGPLAHVYAWLGADGTHWLERPRLALAAIISIGIWKELAFATLFFLAGLQGLPKDCYEAARLEGGRGFATLRHVTIPLMSPVIFLLLVTGLIASVKVFDSVAIMTSGGPVYPSSSTYVYHLYRLAFQDYRVGLASSLAAVFFVGMVAVTVLQFRLARRWVHYEA